MEKDLFNINILNLDSPENKPKLKLIREVTNGAIFEPSSKKFKVDGLFSTEVFGEVGSVMRNKQPGYIDLKVPILHPLVYETIIKLGKKYEYILHGKLKVKFDTSVNNFDIDSEGETGYTYFLKHIDKLDFDSGEPTKSDQRRYRIELVKKYAKSEFMITKWLVIPAGLRDYTENDKGIPSEDEINGLYRKLINAANTLKNTSIGTNYSMVDPIRLRIQTVAHEIFEYIRSLVDGKKKFIQGKFATRATISGTRNVLTPIIPNINNLKEDKMEVTDTVVGLYQYIKAIHPITINRLLTMFLNTLFDQTSNKAYLVNRKTMKTELIEVSTKSRDSWLSSDGINETMNKLGQYDIRFTPVVIDGYYLMLLKDEGDKITVYKHTDDIEDMSSVRPITYMELFYIAIYGVKRKYPAMITRYPVADQGGIYPSTVYVKTTLRGRTVKVKVWDEPVVEMNEYPLLNELCVESMSVGVQYLGKLGADFDGDVLSFVVLYTDESIRELDKFLNSKESILTPNGEILNSLNNDVLDIVVATLTE